MALTWSLLLLVLAGVSTSCPDGFFTHSSSCYLVPYQVASWAEAKVYCQAIGADLATVETQEEHNMLLAHLKLDKASYRTDRFWLDGADYVKEGVWMWTRLQKPIEFTFWGSGEPNNQGQEHCLDMFGSLGFLWDDEHCEARFNFICELPNEDAPVVG